MRAIITQINWCRGLFWCCLLAFSSPAFAQTLPGPADIDRIQPLPDRVIPQREDWDITIPETRVGVDVPEEFKQITLTLESVTIAGATAFTESELASIYGPFLKRDVTLDVVWVIAEQITQRYRNQGYFLSRAFVPAQEIDDGQVRINVVEGHIASVRLDDPLIEQTVLQAHIHQLISAVPLKAEALETFMLQLNDLPGVNFQAVVEPLTEAGDGAAQLTLRPSEEDAQLSITVDNFGSRFLGPYQATATYEDSFFPLQQTTLSGLSSLPTDELSYGALAHRIPISPGWNIDLSGSYVTSEPGATLESSDIESSSIELGIRADYQVIRQRQQNLALSIGLGGKNTNGDILENNPLTRDRIRALRLGLNYDAADEWAGYNYVSAELSRGLDVLGASGEGELNLSRAEATPDFTVLNVSYVRLQSLHPEWLAVMQFAGQAASDPLFSSEEFGYGGQTYGRAYDASEITGDHGVAGSVELRYVGLSPINDFSLTPYSFYDIGRVWNEDRGSKPTSAASAGFGLRLAHETGFSAEIGLGFPLTKAVDTPIYGNGKNPRLIFQVGHVF